MISALPLLLLWVAVLVDRLLLALPRGCHAGRLGGLLRGVEWLLAVLTGMSQLRRLCAWEDRTGQAVQRIERSLRYGHAELVRAVCGAGC